MTSGRGWPQAPDATPDFVGRWTAEVRNSRERPASRLGSDTGVVRPVGLELATSWLPGRVEVGPLPPPAQSARVTLERVVLAAMHSGTTFVAFSGGRDSSAVLAVATHVARREGLPDPIPVTSVYPDLPAAEESEWQQRVLSHLGITGQVVVTVTNQERLLGEPAQRSMRLRGLLWPAAAQVQDTLFRHCRGGLLLTGEGGDEVLGPRRITPLTLLLRLSRRPTRSLLTAALCALLPTVVQRRIGARDLRASSYAPWLTQQARAIAIDQLVRDSVEPMDWASSTWSLAGRRATDALSRNYTALAADHGITVQNPLMDREFVAALANDGGRWGYAGRTDAMRTLFADLLPDPVLAGPARPDSTRRDSVRTSVNSPAPGTARVLTAYWSTSAGFAITGCQLSRAARPDCCCSRPGCRQTGFRCWPAAIQGDIRQTALVHLLAPMEGPRFHGHRPDGHRDRAAGGVTGSPGRIAGPHSGRAKRRA